MKQNDLAPRTSRMRNIAFRCDPADSIQVWVSTLAEAVPRALRDSVMSRLIQILLNLGSEQFISQVPVDAGKSDAPPIFFAFALTPDARQVRLCKKVLGNGFSTAILVVRRSAMPRARHLARREGVGTTLEILDLETLFGSAILLEVGKIGQSPTSIWASMISAYNGYNLDDALPPITVEWKSGK